MWHDLHLSRLGVRVLPNSEKQELQDVLAEARVKVRTFVCTVDALIRTSLCERCPKFVRPIGRCVVVTVQEKMRVDAAALQKHEERAHWEWVPMAAAASTRQQQEFTAAGVNLSVAELRAQLAW